MGKWKRAGRFPGDRMTTSRGRGIPMESLQFDGVTIGTGVGAGAGSSGVWGNKLLWGEFCPPSLCP